MVLTFYLINMDKELEKINALMHKYAKQLDVKIVSSHEMTVKEMYDKCPNILLDLITYHGGSDLIAKMLMGYEELYNQSQNR